MNTVVDHKLRSDGGEGEHNSPRYPLGCRDAAVMKGGASPLPLLLHPHVGEANPPTEGLAIPYAGGAISSAHDRGVPVNTGR